MPTLADRGHDATGLDVAPTAARRFAELREEAGLLAECARVVVGDLFAHAHAAPFDLWQEIEYASGLGADEVVVTGDGDGFQRLEPFRAFVDGVGGELLKHGLQALEPDGVAVCYGQTGPRS